MKTFQICVCCKINLRFSILTAQVAKLVRVSDLEAGGSGFKSPYGNNLLAPKCGPSVMNMFLIIYVSLVRELKDELNR